MFRIVASGWQALQLSQASGWRVWRLPAAAARSPADLRWRRARRCLIIAFRQGCAAAAACFRVAAGIPGGLGGQKKT